MKSKKSLAPARLPLREELRELPQAPRLILDIARLLRARMADAQPDGVMAQNTARVILSHLAVAGEAGQTDLVSMTRLTPPTVSVLLKQMEKEGYVTRSADPADRRAVRVALTEKGHAYDREHLCSISNNDRTAMQGVAPKEEELLNRLLLQIRENLLQQ